MSSRPRRVQIYASTNDAAFADLIAYALHAEGCEIVNGAFDPLTCDAVIVLWSPASIASHKLISATRAPLVAGALASVSIDHAHPPEGFREKAAIGLDGWTGANEHPRWRQVLEEIDRIIGGRAISPAETPDESAVTRWLDEHAPPPRLSDNAYTPSPAPRGRLTLSPSIVFGAAIIGAVIIGGFVSLLSRGGHDKEVPLAEAPDFPQGGGLQAATVAVLQPVGVESAEPPKAQGSEAPSTEAASDAPTAETAAPPTEDHSKDAIADLIVASAAPAETPAEAPHKDQTAPGSLIKDCEHCPELVVIPAGSFDMGAPASEPQRQSSEGPVVNVTIAKPFALGVGEVTFAEWDACAAAKACPALPDSGWGRGRQPAVNVSYEDALSYVAWLSKVSGRKYRLPTEAEWEYAARAGSKGPFSFGVVISPSQANFDGALPYGSAPGASRRKPTPAGTFAASPFGLYDMHGNVWEWVADCWSPSHQGQPADGSARGGACSSRVLKGGAWNTGGWRLRAAHRISKNAKAREYDNGFRVARDLD